MTHESIIIYISISTLLEQFSIFCGMYIEFWVVKYVPTVPKFHHILSSPDSSVEEDSRPWK
jgi:hypothetical protein